MKIIAQGAEARIFTKGASIIKKRFRKAYRLEELDDKLRRSRTRREARVLEKLAAMGFPSPRLIKSDDRETISIEKIRGKLLKDVLNAKSRQILCKDIGRRVAILHNNSIIHGDLTTSNMIHPTSKRKEGKYKIFIIDFGLSFFSDKNEDKAVDLHVLREGLDSKHYSISEKCFDCVIESYSKHAKNADETLKRLHKVEERGRYRAKKGN